MSWLENIRQTLAQYPAWLVYTCGGIVGLGIIWMVFKLMKWALYVTIALVLVALVAGGIWWYLNRGVVAA